jgi:hypothetical protein
MKYTGWCQNHFNVQVVSSHALAVAVRTQHALAVAQGAGEDEPVRGRADRGDLAGEKDANLTFSTTIQPSYKHRTTSIEPTKDKPLCSNKVAREKDAKLAQKLGQL